MKHLHLSVFYTKTEIKVYRVVACSFTSFFTSLFIGDYGECANVNAVTGNSTNFGTTYFACGTNVVLF